MTNWQSLNNEETHQCTAERDGDWITFRCPKCSDYVRLMNFKTGEMVAPKAKGVFRYKHTGLHIPVGLQPERYNPN